MRVVLAVIALAGLVFAQEFEKPVRLEAGGEFINVDIGHAAPYVFDWNKDGKRDLLVGQFGSGKLRIYLNTGSDIQPKYETLEWFKAGGAVATVPAG
ncbi:MAG: hypothetical protein ACYTHK_15200 [Planctomycetota bacterium]|jgi:hypothetical protein